MIAMNEHNDQLCLKLMSAYFEKCPNPYLQVEVIKILKSLQDSIFPLPGNPGGWAAGIIYALANQYRRACGIPGLLNKECEKFFDVSMGTIYKRATTIRKLLMSMRQL